MRPVVALLVALFGFAILPVYAVTGIEVPDPGRGFARDRIIEGFECIGAIGGEVSTYEIYNQYAFVAQGCVMHIWDCGTPGSPRELGWVKFPSYINTIAIRYPAVYVATRYKTVQVIDISDPAHPKYVKDLDACGSSDLSAYVIENVLVIVEDGKYGESYFHYEISKPLSPRLINTGRRRQIEKYATNGRKFFAFGEIHGDYPPRLTVMDLADPNTTFATVATFPDADSYDDFKFAVTEDGLLFDPGPTNAPLKLLSAADLKNLVVDGVTYAAEPMSPVVPCVHEKDYRQIEASQARLRVNQVKLADGKAYLRSEDGWFTILDVKDPASPAVLSQYRHSGLVSFAVERDLLYFYDTSQTLTCLSSTPSPKPEVFSRLGLPSQIGHMVTQGNLLLITTDKGLLVYDFGEPRAPKLAGEFKTKSRCFDVITSGTQAVVYVDRNIEVFDLANPSRPPLCRPVRFMEEYDVEQEEYQIRLKRLGDALYVISIFNFGGQSCEVAVLDLNHIDLDAEVRSIASPDEVWEGMIKPSTIKNPSKPGWVLGLPVSYDQTSGGHSGMNLFDLADPGAPRLCGQYWRLSRNLKHNPVLFKDNIYIADGENGLLILRKTKQTEPGK